MKLNLRTLCLVTALSALPVAAVHAQVSFGLSVAVPGVSIGINMPSYPALVQVPGYPVYYDPQAQANYFFYDGLYWVYSNDNWYASSWYNGPWQMTHRDAVPLFVLRVPVRYYRVPPPYFYGWRADAPPRWGDHWGRDWERRRPGWDRWDSHNVPRPAPLPRYQQKYPGDRYPGSWDQQRAIRNEHDRYEPRERVNRDILGQPGRSDDRRGGAGPQPPVQRAVPIGPQPVQAPQPHRPPQAAQPVQVQPHNARPQRQGEPQVAPPGRQGAADGAAESGRDNRGRQDERDGRDHRGRKDDDRR